MHIVNVKATNFKGVKLVEIEPQKTTTIVGGKNRAGKSSLLDAIAATLGGAKLCPKEPIRSGAAEASCEIRVDGHEDKLLPPCTITRRWRKRRNGSIASELEIITADGYRAPTPQTILNDVVGALGFDPERFLRMKPSEQAEVLRRLVGIDFADLDARRKKVYEERTSVNATATSLTARCEAMSHHSDVPAEEISVAALVTELQRRQAVNRQHQQVRDELVQMQRGLPSLALQIDEAKSQIVEYKTLLQKAEKRLEDARKQQTIATVDIATKEAEIATLTDEDETDIQSQIASSETANRRIRENAERARLEVELTQTRQASAELTKQIKAIDAKKQAIQESAKWPVDGLGYDNNGVTLLDRPFEQASATEQRRAAFAIVAAMNPTLRFAVIKDGSLLDDESMADFARIAAENGFQLFVERVGEGRECSVIISEGEVL